MSSMTGLLILTQPVRKIIPTLPKTLNAASQYVSKTLYVHLDPLARSGGPELPQRISLYSSIINTIYSSAQSQCMDVRILMTGFKHLSEAPQKTASNIDLVLLDQAKENSELVILKQRYSNHLLGCDNKFVYLGTQEEGDADECVGIGETGNEAVNLVFESVVLGGTFDLIHAGHKIFFSEGLLRCSRKFTAGIADGPLLQNKTLSELIAPCSERINNVKQLLTDLDPTLDYHIVRITESLGPTAWDPDMDLIVVSEETKKGIEIINERRADANIRSLKGFIVPLVEDASHIPGLEETKISSSSERMRLLGKIIHPVVPNPKIPSHPYVVGLTGGSASGKSSICKLLEELGAGIVDCDKLGHKAYEQGTYCYNKIVHEFGNDIVGNDREINRKILAPKVFASPENLTKLNNIVWPEIAKLAMEQIKELSAKGYSVVILDAAVLLEAKWDVHCHQIWVCTIKRGEAVKRIMERDGKSRQEAENRIDKQLSNSERVEKANVIFCTQWDKDFTRQQVQTAWCALQEIIDKQKKNSNSQL